MAGAAMREEVASHYRSKGYTIRERVQVRGKSGTIHAVDMVAQGPLGNLVIGFEDAGGFEGPELNAVRRAARDIGATPVVAARRFEERVRVHAAQSGVVLLDEAALHAPPPPPPPEPEEPEYPPWPDAGAPRPRQEPAAWPGQARPAGRMETEEIDAVVDGWTAAPRRGKSTDPGFWRYPREGALVQEPAPVPASPPPRPKATFDWLADQGAQADPGATDSAVATRRASTTSGTATSRASPTHARPGTTRRAEEPSSRHAPLAYWLAAGAAFGATAATVFYGLLRLLG